MLIVDFKSKFRQELASLYPKEEVSSLFHLLIQNKLGRSRLELALHPDMEIEAEKLRELENVLRRLTAGEPIQYILEETEFCGLRFKVNPHVLIPRPETEELVRWIVEEAKDSEFKILDIGTGSGCIPISLAQALPKARLFALDVSSKALDLARENARLNNVSVNFAKADILNPDYEEKSFDLIVSNPPYVRESEKRVMPKNVLAHEPDIALFVKDEDALVFYRKIIEFAREHLDPEGTIYFEINEFLKKDLEELFADYRIEQYEFRKDIFQKYRMVKLSGI